MEADHSKYEIFSDDYEFEVLVPDSVLVKITEECRLDDSRETGGVLIGHYTADLKMAVVADASSPPKDSKHTRSRFTRGILGLRERLATYWTEHGDYYIGEWHYHPYSSPSPSGLDRSAMKRIAQDLSFQCECPILLIIGGDPHARSRAIYVGVFPKSIDRMIQLNGPDAT